MADRRGTGTGKDRDGDITSLCGEWGTRAKRDAIADIDNLVHTYYVDAAGHRANIRPVNSHLRTTADATSANNLDNLPGC